MVNIDVGNIYITSGTVNTDNTITGGLTVKIQTIKIDYNYDNPIGVVPISVSKGNRGTTNPHTRTIDLKRVNEVISVQGFLTDEALVSAKDKRDNLLALAKNTGELSVVWGYKHSSNDYQTVWRKGIAPYGAFIKKMVFTETAGMYSEAPVGGASNQEPAERKMDVQVQLIRGQDS